MVLAVRFAFVVLFEVCHLASPDFGENEKQLWPVSHSASARRCGVQVRGFVVRAQQSEPGQEWSAAGQTESTEGRAQVSRTRPRKQSDSHKSRWEDDPTVLNRAETSGKCSVATLQILLHQVLH